MLNNWLRRKNMENHTMFLTVEYQRDVFNSKQIFKGHISSEKCIRQSFKKNCETTERKL